MIFTITSPKHGTKEVLIDSEDFYKLKDYNWFIEKNYKSNNIYVSAYENNNKPQKRSKISLHRTIVNAPAGMVVDHINHNTLDNRKSNLRICTHSQNICNQKRNGNKSSIYKGLTKTKYGRYKTRIRFNKKIYELGTYKNEKLAAEIYNKKALELFGEFACLNEVENV